MSRPELYATFHSAKVDPGPRPRLMLLITTERSVTLEGQPLEIAGGTMFGAIA
ncbi:hypothetical protein FHW77_000007 [Agrobacterium sp. RC10-4-1]|nr:hypothetical protein [Agrobacterium sp. RC10-4-1]